MFSFTTNYKSYLEWKKYKQNFISIKTGMEPNKISRILNGKQSPTEEEMTALSHAVNKDISFFLDPSFKIDLPNLNTVPIACYVGCASKKQEDLVNSLIDFAENMDAILGIEFQLNGVEDSIWM